MRGFDAQKLKPGELVTLLNSTAQGPVLTARQLDRQRQQAGFRIGDGRTIDLFRYTAWLFDECHNNPLPRNMPRAAGDLTKQAAYSRAQTAAAAEVAGIPACSDPKLRERLRFDLELFLVTCFPATSGRNPLSNDHRRVIARIQEIVLQGGREAKAIYRGFAKSTIAENAALWAILNAHRRFVALFSATATFARDSLESIKRELETNDVLAALYPEVIQPILALEGKPQRCSSQTCGRKPTHIEWSADQIALPFVDGSAAGGAVITAHGLTAAARGLKHKLPDGTQQRPDLVIIDDPQTDESASSERGVNKRLDIIRKVILRLAGHQKQIACILNGTIIQKDDVVDQLTDPKRNPAWQSERIKMVKKFSKAHDTFWLGDYKRLRTSYDPEAVGDQKRAHAEATELYRARREEADEGAEISWEHCFDPECELSALQHAYNILIDDGPVAFDSECQQDPKGDITEEDKPRLAGIAARVNQLARRKVPLWGSHLVGFCDVQSKALFWVVMALADDFTAAIIDYGTWPDQPRRDFSLRDLPRTLGWALDQAGKTGGEEAAVLFGLEQLEQQLLQQVWVREDETELRIERFLVDSGYLTESIYEYCRRSPNAAVLMPSKGNAVPANGKPMTEWEIKPHEKPGFHFVVTTDPKRRAVRLFKHDPYFWKTFVCRRLRTLGHGSLTIFGKEKEEHRLLEEHFKAEFCEYTFGRGRVVWVWKEQPGRDNHWLDAVVGCYAAAAFQGCRLKEDQPAPARKKVRRVTYF